MSYTVLVDGELAAAVESGDALDDGEFRLYAPVGEHDLVISVPGFSRAYHFSVK
jgi:hypothetical protein